MTEKSAEEAAHAHARAVVAGDIGASVRGMTPDALAKAMEIGTTKWTYSGYELRSRGLDESDHIFDITYFDDDAALTLRDRFRNIGGEWKLVDLERVS